MSVPWATERLLSKARQESDGPAKFWDQISTNVLLLGQPPDTHLYLAFEWHRARVFAPPRKIGSNATLVLWLDETLFADKPALRLPMLLEPLSGDSGKKPDVALIGPRSSDALRAMVPWARPTPGDSPIPNSVLWRAATSILGRISIYCATPTAIDEVLVENADQTPRRTVGEHLTQLGFKSFHNFSITGSQLAAGLYQELGLRGVHLTNLQDHIVLISEWDTFYGRSLKLAYEASLYAQQPSSNGVKAYIGAVMGGQSNLLANFHSFVYLRGLDGQTVTQEKSNDRDKSSSKSRPMSLDEIKSWEPQVNRAEGLGQFDYLTRIGSQLEELEDQLERDGEGAVKAIGIVGSDVYDILLILQALRHRFPNVLFFTADLDARFLDPQEKKWARNLIVVTGYGLALHPEIQSDVAPFRDSSQTAQFTAALAALGREDLTNLALQPLCFEIGNNGAVNFSLANVASATRSKWLHPLTRVQSYEASSQHVRYLWGIGIFAVILFGLSLFWQPFARLTWKAREFENSALEYDEDDVRARAHNIYQNGLRFERDADTDWNQATQELDRENRDRIDSGAVREERRKDAVRTFELRKRRRIAFWRMFAGFVIMGAVLLIFCWRDTFLDPRGEVFSLTTGTSVWPAEILRFVIVACSLWLLVELHFRRALSFLELSRKYHLSNDLVKHRADSGKTSREKSMIVHLWNDYRVALPWKWYLRHLGLPMLCYFLLGVSLMKVLDEPSPVVPARGPSAWLCDRVLLVGAVLLFLAVTARTINAALRCSEFILALSKGRSEYPEATIEKFCKKRGNIGRDYIDEWIDIQLIADLTERVGKLVNYPCLLLLLLFIARNRYWDAWSWPSFLVIIFLVNFGVALVSALILQKSAKTAQRRAVEGLTAKVKGAQAARKTREEHEADEAEAILKEIQEFNRGPFVPFWQGPAVGAFFLSSSGITILQLLLWAMEH